MLVKYVKDTFTGRILGVIVATATNCVGFAIAKSSGDITKEVKHDLIMTAAARSVVQSGAESINELMDFQARSRKTIEFGFYDKIEMILREYTDMTYKARKNKRLPTLVKDIK